MRPSHPETCPACGAGCAPRARFCMDCGAKLEHPEEALRDVGSLSLHPGLSKGWLRLWMTALPQESSTWEEEITYISPRESWRIGSNSKERMVARDPYLSENHAVFFSRQGRWHVADQRSANGTFLKLRKSQSFSSPVVLLVGGQRLEISTAKEPSSPPTDGHGTLFWGSRSAPALFCIQQRLRGGQPGFCYRSAQRQITLGTTEGDIRIPEDPFLAPLHVSITYEEISVGAEKQASFLVEDLLSQSGVFVAMSAPVALQQGDWVRTGNILTQVHLL